MHQALVPLQVGKILSCCSNIYELRIVGWVIAKAQSVLKLYNRDLRDINMQFALNVAEVVVPARYLMNEKDTEYRSVKQGFSLARKTVTYKRDDMEAELNIISNPALFRKGKTAYVRFYIARELWMILLDFAKGYRLINLITYLRLTSQYSVKLYLLISQQRARRYLTKEELMAIVGAADVDSFQRGNNFTARVLKQAQNDLTKYSPTSFDFEPFKEGRGGRIVGYFITPKPNKPTELGANKTLEARVESMRSRLDERVKDYIILNFDANEKDCEAVEGLLEQMGDAARQLEVLEQVRHTAAKYGVGNRMGYLVGALRKMIN